MKRRQFLLSLVLALSGYKANAGSLDLEELKFRTKNEFDMAMIERKVSSYWLNALNQGKKLNEQIGQKIMDDTAQAALKSIAQPLWAGSTRDLKWDIVLTDSTLVNACTPGGGLIVVNTGLLAECQEEVELASVIAHEIGHIQHRHAIQRLMTIAVQKEMGIGQKTSTANLINDASMERLMASAVEIIHLSYSRLREYQADAFIIQAFLTAGYSLAKASIFFHKLTKIFGKMSPNFCIYSTHPLTDERIRRIEALAATYGNKGTRGDSEAFRQLKNLL